MSSGIVVVGSINMDLVVRSERMPKDGETLFGRDFKMIPGGKGANQAVAAARLGAKTYMAGRVGADEFGDELLQNLQKANVETDHIARDDEEATGIALIVVNDEGNNSIVVASGANMRIRPDDLDALDDLMGDVGYLILQLEIPLDVVDRALDKAKEHGVMSVLDAGPPTKCPLEILRKADIVSPNETETEALIGQPVRDLDSAHAAAYRLRDLGAPNVVLKLGENGALVASDDETIDAPGIEVKAVDTTAAGDAFTAALTVALSEGKHLTDAVRFANYVGALTVTKFGAQPSLPTREEVESFIRRQSGTTGLGPETEVFFL